MPVHDDLGKRMKEYEYITRTHLMRRTPVIIRVDGKAFHTFTRGFERPFDSVLISSMQQTMKYLCENIQGCVMGYTQSDEITLVLVDYRNLNTAAWFDYNIQKCASVSAGMATLAFNRSFKEGVLDELARRHHHRDDGLPQEEVKYLDALLDAMVHRPAIFDARVFNLPVGEVCNCLYWRQLDAVRNSIQMVGQANFSHSQLHGKSCNQIQEMLFQERGINWNDLPVHLKRGSCCVRSPGEVMPERTKWAIDTQPPMFVGDGRKYVEDRIIFTGDIEKD